MSTYIKETHLKNVQSIVVLCGLECEKLSKEAKLVKEVSNQRNRHQLKKEKKKGRDVRTRRLARVYEVWFHEVGNLESSLHVGSEISKWCILIIFDMPNNKRPRVK